MAFFPFPLNGTVYDSDGITALANVKVICMNVTNNETQTYITNSSGQFMFDLANFTSGYLTGNEISLFASYGNYKDEVVWTVSGTDKTQNLTLDTLIEIAALYCNISDVRAFTRAAATEFSDAAIYDMIKRTTSRIETLTGRYWSGIKTATNELYDGDDTDTLWLRNTDLISITALSIDDNMDGVYTTITTSYVYVYPTGWITLDRNAQIAVFTAGPQSIKVSYTYGNAYPTEDIREMCILMVANLMHYDPQREDMINRIFDRVKWQGPLGLS